MYSSSNPTKAAAETRPRQISALLRLEDDDFSLRPASSRLTAPAVVAAMGGIVNRTSHLNHLFETDAEDDALEQLSWRRPKPAPAPTAMSSAAPAASRNAPEPDAVRPREDTPHSDGPSMTLFAALVQVFKKLEGHWQPLRPAGLALIGGPTPKPFQLVLYEPQSKRPFSITTVQGPVGVQSELSVSLHDDSGQTWLLNFATHDQTTNLLQLVTLVRAFATAHPDTTAAAAAAAAAHGEKNAARMAEMQAVHLMELQAPYLRLQAELTQAVEAEDYEKAAELKPQIKQLKATLEAAAMAPAPGGAGAGGGCLGAPSRDLPGGWVVQEVILGQGSTVKPGDTVGVRWQHWPMPRSLQPPPGSPDWRGSGVTSPLGEYADATGDESNPHKLKVPIREAESAGAAGAPSIAPGFEVGVIGMAKGGVRYIARAGRGLHSRTGSELFHQVSLYKMRRREGAVENGKRLGQGAARAVGEQMLNQIAPGTVSCQERQALPTLYLAVEPKAEEEGEEDEDEDEDEDGRQGTLLDDACRDASRRALPTTLEALFGQDDEDSLEEQRAQVGTPKSLPTVRHGRSAVRSSQTARLPPRASAAKETADGRAAPAGPAMAPAAARFDCSPANFFGLE